MSTCPSGKRQYDTADKAHKYRRLTVSTNIKAGRFHHGALNVYRCTRCPHWHVGHVTVNTPREEPTT